jgi:hypothetical protein
MPVQFTGREPNHLSTSGLPVKCGSASFLDLEHELGPGDSIRAGACRWDTAELSAWWHNCPPESQAQSICFPNHALHSSTAKTLTSLPSCEIITTTTFAIAAKGPILINSIGADDLRLYIYPG